MTTGIMSNYLETRIINHVLRNAYYPTLPSVYVALFKENPGESGSGLEMTSGSAYTRARLTSSFYTPTQGYTSNRVDIIFPRASGSWGTITHAAIMTGSASGSMLFYGQLRDAKDVKEGNIFTIPTGGFQIYLNPISRSRSDRLRIGIPLANAYLNHILNGATYTGPMSEVYLCLYTTMPTEYDIGGIEVVGGDSTMPPFDYRRVRYYGGTSWTNPINGSACNSASIVFTFDALSDWGRIEGICIRGGENAIIPPAPPATGTGTDFFEAEDDVTEITTPTTFGNLLFRGFFSNPISILKGDGLFLSASSMIITMD